MGEDQAGGKRAPRRSSRIRSLIASGGAHLSGAILLAAGVANTFAARRDRADDKRDGDGKNGRDGDRDSRQDRQDKDERGSADRNARRDDRDANREREDRAAEPGRKDRDVGSEQSGGSGRKQDGANDSGESSDTDVNTEQNRRRDDEPDDTSNDGGGGGNNAGSGLFDSPLATKARRRANDFDNRDRNDDEEDGVFVDVDPEGESVYQTDSISYATGPDGIEILTRNITYTAVPTPTPTPFPRLEFPERDGYPFGEDFPFGVARPTPTPGGAATDPGDTPPDGGSAPPPANPEPTTPPVDGGDNSTDFAS